MPRSRKIEPGGICPQCGRKRLIRIVVLFGGSIETCSACGYERRVDEASELPQPVRVAEYCDPTDVLQTLLYVCAVLQTAEQEHGCKRCASRVPFIELKVTTARLEQQREAYVSHAATCTEEELDAFLNHVNDPSAQAWGL